MTNESIEKFKQRHPRRLPDEEPASRKRSGQIALLLMGTMAVGGGAYALMPNEQCDPNRPTIEQPGCRQSSSSSSSGGLYYGGSGGSGSSSSSRTNFASSTSSSSGLVSNSSSSVARSGFGSFGSHFSGGG